MSTLTEGRHTGDFLLSEANGSLSRDNVTVTVPADSTLEAGTVLGRISATGYYVPYDDAQSDGREVAAGVLYDNVVNDALVPADLDGVAINFSAEVRDSGLIWGDGVDEDGGIADLASLGIKAR